MNLHPGPDPTPPSEGSPHLMKVLMYHRIVDDDRLCRAHWTAVHVRKFRQQLEWLDRWGFTAITLDDYRLFRAGELNLPRKPMIITFDDGYLDTYHLAFPLLQEFGMKAVIFVLGEHTLKTNRWDHHLGVPEAPLMDGQHIAELHEAGFEIGAHTMTHVKLPMLPEDKAWQEIVYSRIALERLLDAPVHSFAYPYGLVDGRTKRMVEQAGYSIAYSVGTGPVTFGHDVYETRRLTILSTTGLVGFGLRMLTPFAHYEWTRWKAKQTCIAFTERCQGSWQSLWDTRPQHPQPLETRSGA